jgi:hypothetical protein
MTTRSTLKALFLILTLTDPVSCQNDKFLGDESPRRLAPFFDLSKINIVTIPEPIVIKTPPKPNRSASPNNSEGGSMDKEGEVNQPEFIGDLSNWGQTIISQIQEQSKKYNVTIKPAPLKPKLNDTDQPTNLTSDFNSTSNE